MDELPDIKVLKDLSSTFYCVSEPQQVTLRNTKYGIEAIPIWLESPSYSRCKACIYRDEKDCLDWGNLDTHQKGLLISSKQCDKFKEDDIIKIENKKW